MAKPYEDLFGTQEEALAKAKVIGCYIDDTSFHTMEDGDDVFYMPCKTHQEYDELNEDRSEERSEHISVPDYIQANAERGLENLDKAGDGLVEKTITEARALARGSITEDKLRRLSAWIKRHRGDLQSEQVEDGEISAGVVAHWLWGSGSAEISVGSMLDGADRTIAWADREIIKLDDGERTLEKIEEKIFSSEPKQVRPTPAHDVRYIVNEFEARSLDGSKAVISGYASIFDRSSQVLGGGFVEQIKRGAFTKTLNERGTQTSRDDIKALFNHSTDLVLGSKRAGTLKLSEDSKGLHYEVDLDLDITHHRSAFKMIERGDVTNSSFGFDVIEERWSVPESSDDPVLREVLETRLYEVSPTPFPAYQDSTVSTERSFKGLADMSGLDLRDLVEANEKGTLKELLQQEEETVFNADARKRRLDLLKNKSL
jgi:HK97 family phage prohead protease|tara:strand:- start:503 stop:1789 length:1287 start_codon:yes stop_codon:yes gene_type:complete